MFRQSPRMRTYVYIAMVALTALSIRSVRADSPEGRRTTPVPGGQRAEITLNVPLDAIIFIDGRRTDNGGTTRRFVTPPLASGRKYFYDVKVTWMDGSRAREMSRHMSFRAGERISLNISRPNWTEAAQDLYLDPAAPAPWRSDYYHDILNNPSSNNSRYIYPGSRLYPR